MSRSEPRLRSRYEALRENARDDLFGGRPRSAAERFERTVRLAEEIGDDDLVGAALANQATAALEVEMPGAVPSPSRLRDALTRCRRPESRYRVANALHDVYHARGDLRKSAFYSRVSYQIAPPDRKAVSAHGLGGVLLSRGDVEAALPLIHQARAAWPGDAPLALSTSLLAYAHALAGKHRAAVRYALRSLDEVAAEPPGSFLYVGPIHLNVGFTLLEVGEAEGAAIRASEAEHAVARAGKGRCHEDKMALYLGAEAAFDAGRTDDGEALADRLWRTHYPGLARIGDLLRVISTYRLVNWLA